MKWRKRHTAGLFVCLIGVGYYVWFIHRSHTITSINGWRLDFSYQPFHCPVCLGRVESLTFEGQEIPIPQWDWKSEFDERPFVQMITPVGCVCAFEHWETWRRSHVLCQCVDSDEAISETELEQGWYDAAFTQVDSERLYSRKNLRKRNTPETWCLVATDHATRWIRPDLIDQLAW
ncbi:MAG TPA: hypothetical protein P5081_15855 [Phycisphaerae bacterium]|nr:hypothetical protein [Phycisphaerae bacterium]HRW54346.1 hypothetical protein [Phycisphaerae bacterium]